MTRHRSTAQSSKAPRAQRTRRPAPPPAPTSDAAPRPTEPPRKPKRRVILGSISLGRDAIYNPKERNKAWRPTVAVARQKDLPVDHVILFHDSDPQRLKLLHILTADMRTHTPGLSVKYEQLEVADFDDLKDVWAALSRFVRAYDWKPDEEEYLVHLTPGSAAFHIALYLMTEARLIPGKLIQTSEVDAELGKDPELRVTGAHTILDLQQREYEHVVGRLLADATPQQVVLKNGIATRNKVFNAMIERIEFVATSSRGVILLMGPTGAGKSELARRIYGLLKAQGHVTGRFESVNCGTLRGDIAKSELFGHVPGGFTGATVARLGALSLAHDGVLFLDEIGELGLEEQKLLLHAIEEGRFRPVGAEADVQVRFRLIVGTNRPLEALAARGEFRPDLLARINQWTFRLPSLAERVEDLEPNLDYELRQVVRLDGRPVRMMPAARERFLDFARSREALWLQNFRDLHTAVDRMATLAPAGVIRVEEVAEEIALLIDQWRRGVEAGVVGARGGGAALDSGTPGSPHLDGDRGGSAFPLVRHYLGDAGLALDRFERVRLEDVLRVCLDRRHLLEAATELMPEATRGLTPKRVGDRLRYYLRSYGLSFERVIAERPRG